MIKYYQKKLGVKLLEPIQYNNPKPKVKKTIPILILIIAIGFCAFAFYNNSYFFNIRRLFTGKTAANAKVIFSLKYNPEEKPEFIPYEDSALYITKNSIKSLNFNNTVNWEIKYNFTKPIIKAYGKYIFIADGKKIFLYKANTKLWEKLLDFEATNAKLNKNGNILVFRQDGINDQIAGFNAQGSKIFKRTYSKNGYLINADISTDNKKIVVLSASTQKSSITSKVEIFEVKSTLSVNSVPVCGIIKEDLLATDIKIFGIDNIILVADNRILSLDSKGKERWVKDFSGQKVYKANISSGKYIVLEQNGTIKSSLLENKSREIQVLNGEGVIEGEGIKITSPVANIDVFENYFLINDSNSLYSISKGKLIWSCYLDKDIKYTKAFYEKAQVLLVSRDTAEVIQVN